MEDQNRDHSHPLLVGCSGSAHSLQDDDGAVPGQPGAGAPPLCVCVFGVSAGRVSECACDLVNFFLLTFPHQASGSRLKHIDQFDGGTHNGTWTCYGYYDCINRFLTPVSQWFGRASAAFVHSNKKLTKQYAVASNGGGGSGMVQLQSLCFNSVGS